VISGGATVLLGGGAIGFSIASSMSYAEADDVANRSTSARASTAVDAGHLYRSRSGARPGSETEAAHFRDACAHRRTRSTRETATRPWPPSWASARRDGGHEPSSSISRPPSGRARPRACSPSIRWRSSPGSPAARAGSAVPAILSTHPRCG
jgi:hypothetical protein